jgi:1-acyl-sn-glycerol-3-phosphate acyltransferase
MIKQLFKYFFDKKGWKTEGELPEDVKKCVIIGAPHTSNWDFVYGVGALAHFNLDVKYLAKKELFVFPLKKMFVSLGGIPVDRSKSGSLVENIVKMFKENERLIVLIPPEGTRKNVKKWKTGFYRVEIGADVPIVLGSIDYVEKTVKLGTVFYPSGNVEKDYQVIRDYYRNVKGKIPENFSLPEITP